MTAREDQRCKCSATRKQHEDEPHYFMHEFQLATEDQPQLGTCPDCKSDDRSKRNRVYWDRLCTHSFHAEDQPRPTVSSLCRQTHHDFCAIPGCSCPCHADVEQKLTDAAFPAQVGGPLVVDLGTAIDIVASEAQGEAPQFCGHEKRFIGGMGKCLACACEQMAGEIQDLRTAVETGAHPNQDARAQIDKDETIIAIMESHANWVARAETAEAEVERLKVELERRDPTREAAVALLVERAEKAEKELASGSTPSKG